MFLTFGFFLVPLIMIIHGVMTYNDQPKFGTLVGYRTKRSLNCEETFVFANKMLSEYFIRFNCISLLITVLNCIMYSLFGRGMNIAFQVIFFLTMGAIHIACCVVPFILVEKKLKIMIEQRELEIELKEEREKFFQEEDEIDSFDELLGVNDKLFFYGNEDVV